MECTKLSTVSISLNIGGKEYPMDSRDLISRVEKIPSLENTTACTTVLRP